MEHDGVLDDSAYRPAMPCDALPGPPTDPPVVPSAFPGCTGSPPSAAAAAAADVRQWLWLLSCCSCQQHFSCCFRAACAAAAFLLWHVGRSSLQPTPAALPMQGLWGVREWVRESGVWCLSAWSRFHRTHRIRPPRPGWAGRRHTAVGAASIASLLSPPRPPPPCPGSPLIQSAWAHALCLQFCQK